MTTDNNIYQPLILPTILTVTILLIPLIAMLFTDEVNWDLFDFIIAGTLIFGASLSYTFLTRKSAQAVYKIAIGFALISGLLLIWVNGAVGLIGSENNSINLLYFGVLGIGVIGALISRFKSLGMSFTLFAMAVGQALVAIIALISGMHLVTGSSVTEILGVNGFFIMLFVVAGLLFQHAGKNEESEIEL